MKKNKIYVLGLRGIPKVQGGVETHVENLAPLLVKQGYDVTVLARKGYQPELTDNMYKGVKIKTLWSPKIKGAEAFLHTLWGVLYAVFKRPDILHIHAVGPSLFVPLARLFGIKVVITHHGPDYDRQKWGGFAKRLLQLGEKFGSKYASEVIVISKTIQNLVKEKYSVDATLIPNGVVAPPRVDTFTALKKYGLSQGKYILIVSRLVPEKRHLDLITAFETTGIEGWKLVIVGSSDYPDEYSNAVMQKGKQKNNHIVTTGFLSGEPLQELFAHAGLFVLPSSHEGLPIAMLEALSYGLPVIASDIPANLEVELTSGEFFELGNVEQLKKLLIQYTSTPIDDNLRNVIKSHVLAKYDWSDIAVKTSEVYSRHC